MRMLARDSEDQKEELRHLKSELLAFLNGALTVMQEDEHKLPTDKMKDRRSVLVQEILRT